MIPSTLMNPFLAQSVDDTLVIPPGDVPELHQEVVVKCGKVLAQARHAEQRIGLLILGEAGSGKSHLMARLRHQLNNAPGAALAVIRLYGAYAGRLWRHIRENLAV